MATPEMNERETATAGRSVTPERFARIRRLFEAALELNSSKRQAFLENACAGDQELFEEINGMLIAEEKNGALLEGVSPSSNTPSSTAPEEGRFPAGTVLAGRYRILGLLGKGGMGEVYKAFDLILNQSVALKFLTPARISEAALVRFRNEVRTARQVSHPNVCRVYDVGMTEGLHFLSMEYIDGEDLASLLRRIGRLPQDKAIEFTRKICAGLGAAHERGVLHRDLKPTNIMIDGRGQPRIADFGLAALAQEIPLSDLRSGTPAYMSPEQKEGKEVTTRSDIYSLGLVLHEMFTGKARKDTQSTPSELVKELDPTIERLILRCLEEDPKRRPSSALSVAMALPGGDPIAAALAAGETPSPEMIAASGEKEGFSPRTAMLCFAAIIVLAVIGSWVELRTGLAARAPMPRPPQVLADRAQELLRSIGYAEAPLGPAYGFECCDQAAIDNLARYDAARREEILASHQPPITLFWYRQNQIAPAISNGVFTDGPAPGLVRILLDAQGRLNLLKVRPWTISSTATPVEQWPALFSAAGLDIGRFTPATPESVPDIAADTRVAWVGSYSADSMRPEKVRVEAASWEGRPVLFEVKWLPALRLVAQTQPRTGIWPSWAGEPDSRGGVVLYWFPLAAAVGLIACRNLRQGRVDLRGAAVIGCWTLVMGLGVAALMNGPAANPPFSASFSVVVAAFLCISYVAIEPFVRRHWPDSFISWTRVCAGKVRNPLVASHILVGIVGGEAFLSLYAAVAALFSPVPLFNLQGLGSIGDAVGFAMGTSLAGLLTGLTLLAFAVVLRLALRNIWVADWVAALLVAIGRLGSFGTGWGRNLAVLAFFTPVTRAWVWLLRRFGFLAMVVVFQTLLAGDSTPFLLTGWIAGQAVTLRLIPVAVAIWALWVIVSAQRGHPAEAVI